MTLLSQILTSIRVPENLGKFVPKSDKLDLCGVKDCPECGGSGWVRYDLPPGHPSFGKLFRCPNMDITKLFGKVSGLAEDEYALNIGDVFTDFGGPSLARACEKLIDLLGNRHGWMYVWGGYGTAKTLLLKVAVSMWLRSDQPGAYVRIADVLDELRSAFDEGVSHDETSRLQFWNEIPLLALDEIDMFRSTPFAQEKLFQLLDHRYESAIQGKTVTVIASNSDTSILPSYLADRINDGRFYVCHLEGLSARPFMQDAKEIR